MMCAVSLLPADAQTSFLASYLKARPVTEQALAVAGGADAIRKVAQLEYRSRGSVYNVFQSFDAEKKAVAEPIDSKLAFDFKNNRLYQLIAAPIRGINVVPSPTFYKDGSVYSLKIFRRSTPSRRASLGPRSMGSPDTCRCWFSNVC